MPHLKTAYQKYQGNDEVEFLLVSLDSDPKRLQRFLDSQQFPMPVVRASQAHVQQAMGIDDVPATFYVDGDGVVRYQTSGFETHGDSAARVGWFVDELRR